MEFRRVLFRSGHPRLVPEAGGRPPYYVTFRLLHLASENWPTLEGWATSRNTDLMELPIDRLLNLVYFWATRDAQDEQTLAKFDRKLWMPPKGEEPQIGRASCRERVCQYV